MLVRWCLPPGARAARPAHIGLLAYHARGEPPARQEAAPAHCRETASFSQREAARGPRHLALTGVFAALNR